MPVTISSYNLGFTAFGLGATHARALAAVFREEGDWEITKTRAIAENIFRQSKSTSLSRLEREFRLRLQTLTPGQIELLDCESAETRVPIALLSVFKRYQFIRDFSVEVLGEKSKLFDFELRPSDYSAFLELKETEHPELADVSDTTARKLRQVTLRILTEGEILADSEPQKIAPSPLPETVVEAIRDDDPSFLLPFLHPFS